MILLIYGALLVAPFTLNFVASRDDYRRHVDALFVSGMLCAIWAFTNFVAQVWPFPQSKEFHPLVDLIGLVVCVAAYMTQRQAWKLILALLFLAQLVLHAWFWAAWVGWIETVGDPIQLGRTYILMLNLLWFGQLICVGAPGGTHVARRLGRSLHAPRSLRDLVWR